MHEQKCLQTLHTKTNGKLLTMYTKESVKSEARISVTDEEGFTLAAC